MASPGSNSGITSETRDRNGLCLLSLDGGGVRGLSTLLILKGIMQQINSTRQREGFSHVKPCDVFDLIGGTSTGGLIAIMLGRLRMDIQPCIDAYSKLSRHVFDNKGLSVDWRGRVKGRFKASELESAIKEIVRASGLSDSAVLDDGEDGEDRGCRAFVCAARKENKAVAHLRAYQVGRTLIEDRATIWEAARATSAASGFFDPISIGKHGQEYVDAGLGCNNPVQEVWTEAQDIWSPGEGDLATLVKCFISIGTGNPGTSPIEDSAFKMFTKTLEEIATETEKTAETFVKSHRDLFSQKRYFRFNVDQGLQSVGLEEYKKEKEIVSATTLYMESQHMALQVQSCSQAMKDKEFWKGDFTQMNRLILKECQHAHEPFGLPFSLATAPEINYFVGRVKNLSSIESALLPITRERKIVVLYGLGGIGKSQLAIEYAKKHRYDYTAVFWLNAKTEDTLKRSFVAGARRLPEQNVDQELLYGSLNEVALDAIVSRMKKWLDNQGNHRWLLIYDNVDNPKIPDNKTANAYDIRSYFPQAHQGSILVTTRWKSLTIGHLLEVAKLSKVEDSISLLRKRSYITSGQDAGLRDIAMKLDGLPLALATAGSYLFQTSISASKYLQHHKTSWLELQRMSPKLLSYEDHTIYTTWNMSYIHIRKADMSAAKLLEFWACFDNNDLWYDLLEAGNYDKAPDWFRHIVGSELAFEAAVFKLQNHALVERSKDSHGYSMHHCVHAWVKNVLSKTIEDQNMSLALACVGRAVPLKPARGDWMMKKRVLPHCERLLEMLSYWDQEDSYKKFGERVMAEFFHDVGDFYVDLARLTKAESLLLRAFDSYKRVYGPDFEGTPDIIHSLALLYDKQGRLTKAQSMYERVMTRDEDKFGPDHDSTLRVANNLACLYRHQGKHTKAESMYQRILSARQKTLGSDYGSAMAMFNLGSVYIDQGKLKEAEQLCQRALISYEKVLGEDHPITLNAVNKIGRLYKFQGRLKEAESMHQRALTNYERTLPRDHKSALDTAIHLGVLYQDLGKLTEAESMYQRALMGYEKSLGPDHQSTLDAVNILGLLHYRQGKLTEAESMYQRALMGYEKSLGPDHQSILDAVYNLGLLHDRQGKLMEAESMYQRALMGYEKSLGLDHRSTLDAVYNLGLLYNQQGKLIEAESICQRALTGYNKSLGPDHASTLTANNMMGVLYHDQGKLKEAESMFLRALRGYTRNPPPDPKGQLRLFYNLGLVYQDMQDFGKAKEFFSKAYRGSQELWGSQHDDTIKALNALNALSELDGEIEREKQGARSHQTNRRTRRHYERRVIFPWRRRI